VSLEHASAKSEIPKEFRYPVSPETILRKRQALKKELLKQLKPFPMRIAVLGGSTTTDVTGMLELFLLTHGIQPSFYESAYNAYYEEVLFKSPGLWNFKPDIVFVHTTWQNVSRYPDLMQSDADVDALIRSTMNRFGAFWSKIHNGLGALIIQNNFDLPRQRPLANLDSSAAFGRVRFLHCLNEEFARFAANHSYVLINDIHYLSAQVGLADWFDYSYWYNYHMAVTPVGAVAIGQNVASLIRSAYGKAKKCLVLDLDNTLWGGVIGDDGLENIILGRDHPVGEAFADFQEYAKQLRKRGVLLAVCSKNDLENAKKGFSHPDTVLKVGDFSAFKANWNPKSDNLREIAAELNIGLDSFVFVDDNPVERALVATHLPEVAVPDVGSDVSLFAEILEREGYFEPTTIVSDDLQRANFYGANVRRAADESHFQTYDDFLASLEMTAEIAAFAPVYLDRLTQLINKTNQFNLTTRRYTNAEVEAISRDPAYITLYGRLCDKYGDNGLVSVIIASVQGDTAQVELWLMSCRVLKREMEYAMFDALVEDCLGRHVRRIVGTYIPSQKNGMVAEHYARLGFSCVPDGSPERTTWHYEVSPSYCARTRYIRRNSREAITSETA
jgi:FkbH-like protein